VFETVTLKPRRRVTMFNQSFNVALANQHEPMAQKRFATLKTFAHLESIGFLLEIASLTSGAP
jgi:hypothetical protein